MDSQPSAIRQLIKEQAFAKIEFQLNDARIGLLGIEEIRARLTGAIDLDWGLRIRLLDRDSGAPVLEREPPDYCDYSKIR